ncbi:MAG TPA: Fe-S cluster assembly protein SufD, partial [Tahibacter sp.]|nr:Fe-S cluster assembly protein SufD [Tahibacter sp.]
MSAPLLQELERGFDALPASRRYAAGLAAARRAQLTAALSDGLPGARAERWRHTSLRALERRAFSPLPATADVDPAVLAAIPAPRIVFVNGVFAPQLSQLDDLPEGVSLLPLSQALQHGDAREVEFLARRFEAADETFARLNAAFALDGLLLRVAAGVRCDRPVALVMLGAAAGGDHAVHLRHCVELGDGAQLTFCEYQLAASPQAHLLNSFAHLHLRRGARLDHVRVQGEDAGATVLTRSDAVLGTEADYRRTDLEFGAA